MSLTLTQHSWQAPLARSQVSPDLPKKAGFSGILLAVKLLHIFKHAL